MFSVFAALRVNELRVNETLADLSIYHLVLYELENATSMIRQCTHAVLQEL